MTWNLYIYIYITVQRSTNSRITQFEARLPNQNEPGHVTISSGDRDLR